MATTTPVEWRLHEAAVMAHGRLTTTVAGKGGWPGHAGYGKRADAAPAPRRAGDASIHSPQVGTLGRPGNAHGAHSKRRPLQWLSLDVQLRPGRPVVVFDEPGTVEPFDVSSVSGRPLDPLAYPPSRSAAGFGRR